MLRWLTLGLAALLLAAPAAQARAAACTTQGSPDAKAISADQVELHAALQANLGLWIGVISKKNFTPALGKMDGRCARAEVQAGGAVYTLRGDNGDDWVPRVATPARRKGPVAYLIAVPDLALMVQLAGTGVTPRTLGYALVTTDGAAHTVWQFYDAIPPDAVLVRDLTLDLSGQAKANMQWKDDKITIVVPKAALAGAPVPPPPARAPVTMEMSPKDFAASLNGPGPARAMAYFKASYLTGACAASTSPDLARLKDLLRIDRLKLEPADELQRSHVGLVGLQAKEAGARAPLKPEVCASALPQTIADFQATP